MEVLALWTDLGVKEIVLCYLLIHFSLLPSLLLLQIVLLSFSDVTVWYFFMFFCQILGLAVNNSDCINVLDLLCFPEKIKLIGFSGLYSSLTLMRSI